MRKFYAKFLINYIVMKKSLISHLWQTSNETIYNFLGYSEYPVAFYI